MIENRRYFVAPFVHEHYYHVLVAWLDDVEQPLDLDVRELVCCAQVEHSGIVALDGEYDPGLWVRSPEDGLPNLVSHVTFQHYFAQLLRPAGSEPGDTPLPLRRARLARRNGERDLYDVMDWESVGSQAVVYKPRAYLSQRWPLRLGRANGAGRAALLALFAAITDATPERAPEPVIAPITLRQIRARAQQLLPRLKHTRAVGGSLRQLESLGLISEVDKARNNTTYRLNLAAFEGPPEIDPRAVAAACGLHPEEDAAWVQLVCAFLESQARPVAQASEVWRQLRHYQRVVETAEDAVQVVRLIEDRKGKQSTGMARVMRDYQEHKQQAQAWLESHPFVLRLNAGGVAKSDETQMPAVYGKDVHLQATQLLLEITCGRGVTRHEAAALLQGSQLLIWQGSSMIPITGDLRIDEDGVAHGRVLDCNHLHRQVDYAAPFAVMLIGPKTGADVQLIGRFRVRRTR